MKIICKMSQYFSEIRTGSLADEHIEHIGHTIRCVYVSVNVCVHVLRVFYIGWMCCEFVYCIWHICIWLHYMGPMGGVSV